jgi:hypothetical protein
MKKFIFKFIVLFLLIIISLISIILIPAPENNYMQTIFDKHQRLMNTESPRIVLVGGSNIMFGIDSKAIQSAFNISVTNVGIHAGIGLGRMIDDIAPLLHDGDILVIASEYPHFTSNWNGSGAAYELIFDAHRYSLIAHPPFYGPPSMFSTYVKTKVLSLIPRPPNPLAESRDGVNEYGDYVKHLEVENQPITSNKPLGKVNAEYLSAFFLLVDFLTDRGIQVLISYPSYEEVSYRNSADTIHEIDAALRAKENITVISIPDNYCFPTEYFYDTVYHLNAKGREIRTARLIEDLKRQLGQ